MTSLRDEPFRANTSKQPIDKGLLARWKGFQAWKQAEVGTIRTVTINEMLKDFLDYWEAGHPDQVKGAGR